MYIILPLFRLSGLLVSDIHLNRRDGGTAVLSISAWEA